MASGASTGLSAIESVISAIGSNTGLANVLGNHMSAASTIQALLGMANPQNAGTIAGQIVVQMPSLAPLAEQLEAPGLSQQQISSIALQIQAAVASKSSGLAGLLGNL